MNIFYAIIDTVATTLEMSMGLLFVSCFVEKKSNKHYRIVNTMLIVCCLIMNVITTNIEVFSSIRGIVITVVIMIMSWNYSRDNKYKIIVMSITYCLLVNLIDFSTVAIMTYGMKKEFSFFTNMTLFRVAGTIISKGIMIGFVLLLYTKMSALKRIKSHYLIGFFILTVTNLGFATYIFQNFMKRDQIYITEVLMFVLLLMIEVLVFYVFSMLTRDYESEERIRLLNLYNDLLQKSAENEKKSFQMWQERIHDYKHHVIYMQELLERHDYQELEDYMKEETGNLKQYAAVIDSGYYEIDAVINSKIMLAEGWGIHMCCTVNLPAGLELDKGAMVSCLANLLDNAINAEKSQDEKTIEIVINYMKENLYIKVVNHSKETVDFDVSSQKDRSWHGIGLKSVKDQVEKLNGFFKIEQESDQVIAMIVFYNVKQNDSEDDHLNNKNDQISNI